MRCLDELGVVEGTAGQLWEGLAVGRDTLRLHLESALLRHGSVPAGEGSQLTA